MSVPADHFGNLGKSTDFLNTNALGLDSGVNIPAPSPGPTVNATGATPAPAATPPVVGIGGTGVGGAPTPAPVASGSTGTDWGSLFGNLGSDISSILNSPLGSLAEFTALYKIISGQASDTQKQNKDLAGQISAIGQPDVTAGKNLLDAYTSGNLTAPFQAQLDAARAADAETATSQTQQVASMLANAGGQNMQSAQVSQAGQIEKQKNLADQTAMSNAFLAELSASLSLTSTGGAFVQAGIMQEIQSNTQLQGQLADLMGALAKAYAEQTANSGKGGSGGGIGGLINDVGSIWKGVTNLFGGSGSGVDALATATSGIGDISAAPGLAGNVAAAGEAAAGNIAGLDLGGGAAAGGAGAAGAGAGGAAGAGAAGAGTAGAGAAGAGAAGAAGAGAAGAAGTAGAYSSSPAVIEAINAAIPDAAAAAGGAAGAGAGGAEAGSAAAASSPTWAAAGPAAIAAAAIAILGNYAGRKQDQADLNKGAGPGTGWLGNYKGVDMFSNRPIDPERAKLWDEFMALHANDQPYGPGHGSDAGTGH